jgi:rhodanese-related sulfurtransferase
MICFWPLFAVAATGNSEQNNVQTDTAKKHRIESMISEFEPKFNTPQIEVTAVERLVKEKNYVLLDVREPKETRVSIIPGAITKEQFEQNPTLYKDKKIIAYCTIGYRSSKFAERMNKQGYQISNMRGSLLLWSHAGGALVNARGEPTQQMHVYGRDWDLLPKRYQSTY